MNMSNLFKDATDIVSKHSPEILTGLGIAGMISSTILAVKATPKALRLMKARQEELYPESTEKLPAKEVVKTTWKCYIPSAVTGVVSTACLVGASKVSAKRNAVLATAYKLSETALTEYREKVVETIGEKKEQVVRDAVMKEKIDRNPISNSEVIAVDKYDTTFYDPWSSRYFKSDIEKVRKIVNDLNFQMLNEDTVSLNDFYHAVGLSSTAIGDSLGWNINRGKIEVRFSPQKDDHERPCLGIDFIEPPKYGYDEY